MMSDRIKQKARLSILDKLKQKMPVVSPYPGTVSETDEMLPTEMEGEIEPGREETLNDMDIAAEDITSLMRKKKRPSRPSIP